MFVEPLAQLWYAVFRTKWTSLTLRVSWQSWGLLDLAQQPQVQDRLRSELREAQSNLAVDGRLTAEQLLNLPYLDAVTVRITCACVGIY